MSDNDDLRKEVDDLKAAVRHLTGAVKVLTEKDDRAKEFIEKVDELLQQSLEATVKAAKDLPFPDETLKEMRDRHGN